MPNPRVETWLAAQDGAAIYLTTVSEAELWYGVAILPAGRKRNDLAAAIEAILEDDFCGRILTFDRVAARVYADIAAVRRAMGHPIGQFDCQIAAIARVHAAAVATRNHMDFADCGISVLNPWL